MKKIYLAGGCFWGVQEYFSRIKGVINTKVGYVNSEVEDPGYELVCSGKTRAAEAVEIEYDEQIISLDLLLRKFFDVIDPTVLNRQGNDIGTQYRTGIYYVESEDAEYIKKFINIKQLDFSEKILTEVNKLYNFYIAEDSHQNYLKKNPNGYCHINLKM